MRDRRFNRGTTDANELEWYIPAAVLPSDLQSCLNVISQFLENPLDLEGKKASQLLSKKRRRRLRRPSPSSDPDASAYDIRNGAECL